jgi:hypothetical protein
MSKNISLTAELYDKVKVRAQAAGFNSPDAYVEEVLAKDIAQADADQNDKLARKMQELGYIDAGLDI